MQISMLQATDPHGIPQFFFSKVSLIQEIYTEVNDQLEMSQIAQQKLQAKLLPCPLQMLHVFSDE